MATWPGYTHNMVRAGISRRWVFVLCAAGTVGSSASWAQQPLQRKEVAAPLYELTETDLATIPDMDTRRIAVFGLKLGDPREEVLKRFAKTAQPASWNAALLFVRLGGKSAEALSAGLILSFDKRDRVASIDLETGTRSGALPEVLAKKLQGKTRALFLKYSDELRLEVLGVETRKYQVPNPPLTVYQYPVRGLSLGVYRDAQGREHVSGLLLALPEPVDKPVE